MALMAKKLCIGILLVQIDDFSFHRGFYILKNKSEATVFQQKVVLKTLTSDEREG